MFALSKNEIAKRGCLYCLDHTKKRLEPDSTKKSHVCIHDGCPYHELDKYDTYGQYLKAEATTKSLKHVLMSVFEVERKLE